MIAHFRISQRHHTGKHLPREHTSYPSLLFLLFWLGLVLAGVTTTTEAATSDGGFLTVKAKVSSSPPKTAAVITSPAANSRTSVIPITVSGTCESGMLVNVFKNDVLAGAVICSSAGTFQVPIDLFAGRNDLVAKTINTNNQAGPDSAVVTVFYDPPGLPSGIITGDGKFGSRGNIIIKSESIYRGASVGEEISWELETIGGVPPYAVSIAWGDGTSDLISRPGPGRFTVKHIYEQPGNGYKGSFVLLIKATDAEGNSGQLQLVTIVSPKSGLQTSPVSGGVRGLLMAWPLWVMAVMIVVSYWLGERHQKKSLERQGLLIAP
jgi:hypothetical protein